MQIGSWWAITIGTLTGPWHVTSKGRVWYIVNMLTLTTKKIGGPSIGYKDMPVSQSLDRAIEIARKRNAKFLKEHREELPLYLGRYPEFDKTITEVLKGA